MRVKDREGNRKVVRHRWAKYFDELLNVEDGVQAINLKFQFF